MSALIQTSFNAGIKSNANVGDDPAAAVLAASSSSLPRRTANLDDIFGGVRASWTSLSIRERSIRMWVLRF
jgi:hypothetical protein